MSDGLIHIDGVCKAFGARVVLRDVCAEVKRGESVFVCGVNGAGKSTLLGLINGSASADAGAVRFGGDGKASVGVISHKAMVYPELTVLENLRFFAGLYGVKGASAKVDAMVERLGLGQFRFDRAGVLSRGLLQRLAIGRAMIHAPDVLLADEPFTGLDAESVGRLREVIDSFGKAGGTVVMTSHDTGLGLDCCGRVWVLDDGGIVLDREVEGIDREAFLAGYVEYAGGGR